MCSLITRKNLWSGPRHLNPTTGIPSQSAPFEPPTPKFPSNEAHGYLNRVHTATATNVKHGDKDKRTTRDKIILAQILG
jgi:hypothetical protein